MVVVTWLGDWVAAGCVAGSFLIVPLVMGVFPFVFACAVGALFAWAFGAGAAVGVGVVATGALLARSERQRRSYTPDEVRDRLRERYQATERGTSADAG